MCSQMAIKGTVDEMIELFNTSHIKEEFLKILNTKGGDEYKFILKVNNITFEIPFGKEVLDKYNNYIMEKLECFNLTADCVFIAFSRLTPEMEILNQTDLQPYVKKDGSIVMCHGTIANAEEIARQYKFAIDVDTDIFKHLAFGDAIEEASKRGAKISTMLISNDNDIITYENGLGMYTYDLLSISINLKMYTNIYISDGMLSQFFADNRISQNHNNFHRPKNKTRIVSLFSGGLDITASTYKTIQTFGINPIESVDLWYFDWGTVANKEEISTGRKFIKTLINEFPDVCDKKNTHYATFDIKNMFKNILDVCDTSVRLVDSDATGAGSAEAESAISYVPFRNQFLLTLAAAKAEEMYPDDNVVFVLGANLSEGMIYLDNSETFTINMDKVIKVGGQKTQHFMVYAPFVNKTKTELVKYCIEQGYNLDDVFSCYFPTDGKECGKCGSCLLKKNAFERAK